MSTLQLQRLANSIHLSLTEALCGKLEYFAQQVLSRNAELNLVGPADDSTFRIKHLLDSLAAIRYLDLKPGMKVLDLGTGAGLPGIPLAILFPDVEFTLMDATAKKIEAVDGFIQKLGLSNVRTVTGRAEELAHDPAYREDFDRVLSRAVAPLRVLLELAYPFVHLNGRLAAYKGPEYLNELLQARNAITSLQAESPQVKLYSLPEKEGERACLVFTKHFQTPARYPRRDGMPAKRPL
ncbi:MAG: 16S rRNA (guanine(527)-N(7))-methyltransferase RsmG [Candidatus Peregrinibacteria bacterium]